MSFYYYNKMVKIIKLFIFILIIYIIFKLKYINNNIFIKAFLILKKFLSLFIIIKKGLKFFYLLNLLKDL